MNKKAMNKLEETVKKQSKLLAEKMPFLLEVAKGKFVAFFNGDLILEDSHAECFEKAVKKFGPNSGFVIDEVTSRVAMVSALVKLK